MTRFELKTLLINRIQGIDDVKLLNALKIIVDTQTGSDVIQLTPGQIKDILESKKEIKKGKFVENNILDKQVRQWLKSR